MVNVRKDFTSEYVFAHLTPCNSERFYLVFFIGEEDHFRVFPFFLLSCCVGKSF